MPTIVGVPAGIVESGEPVVPTAHYYAPDKATWHQIVDALPQRAS